MTDESDTRIKTDEFFIIPRGPSILVEGPDCVGKTTLCKQMSELTGIPVWKCPAEKDIFRGGAGGVSLWFDLHLANLLDQTAYRIISDRSFLSEAVYAQVFGRQTDAELLDVIELRHYNIGTKVLYVHSSELPHQEDDLVPKERYWDVKRAYDAYLTDCLLEAVAVDTASMLRAYREGGDISRDVALSCLSLLGVV